MQTTNGKVCSILGDAWNLQSSTIRFFQGRRKCDSNGSAKLQEQLGLFFLKCRCNKVLWSLCQDGHYSRNLWTAGQNGSFRVSSIWPKKCWLHYGGNTKIFIHPIKFYQLTYLKRLKAQDKSLGSNTWIECHLWSALTPMKTRIMIFCALYKHANYIVIFWGKKNPNYGLGSNFSEQSMSWRVEKGDTTQLKSQQSFSLLLPLFVLYMLAFRNIWFILFFKKLFWLQSNQPNMSGKSQVDHCTPLQRYPLERLASWSNELVDKLPSFSKASVLNMARMWGKTVSSSEED